MSSILAVTISRTIDIAEFVKFWSAWLPSVLSPVRERLDEHAGRAPLRLFDAIASLVDEAAAPPDAPSLSAAKVDVPEALAVAESKCVGLGVVRAGIEQLNDAFAEIAVAVGPDRSGERIATIHARAAVGASRGRGRRVWESIRLGDAQLTGSDARRVTFRKVDFRAATIGNARFERCRFERCFGKPRESCSARFWSCESDERSDAIRDASPFVRHEEKSIGSTPFHVRGDVVGPIGSVAYSPDGSEVASGSDDGSVRAWDMKRTRAAPRVPIGLPEAWAVCNAKGILVDGRGSPWRYGHSLVEEGGSVRVVRPG